MAGGSIREKDIRVAIKRVVKRVIEQGRRGAQGMALGNPRVRRVEFKAADRVQTETADAGKPEPLIQGPPFEEPHDTDDSGDEGEHESHMSPKYVIVKNTFLHYPASPPDIL